MKKNIIFCFSAIMALITLGCGPTAMVVSSGGPTIVEAQNVDAAGKMRIAVARFENKSSYMVGEGMTDMLTSALFRTGRFIVLERESLDAVLQEQRLSSVGVIDERTAIPSGLLEGAEFLVLGAVTMFEPDARGARTLVGGARQSRVAIDMRIVDSTTARVVAAVTVEGSATDFTLDAGLLKYVGVGPIISGLRVWSNTPMDKAIRICLEKAVDHIITYSMKGAKR